MLGQEAQALASRGDTVMLQSQAGGGFFGGGAAFDLEGGEGVGIESGMPGGPAWPAADPSGNMVDLAAELHELHSDRIHLVAELTKLKMRNSQLTLYAQHLVTVLGTLKQQNKLMQLQLVCLGEEDEGRAPGSED